MINTFNKIFYKLARWFQPKYDIKFTEEIPDIFLKRTIYIVGTKKDPWLITFLCPCGCKNNIQLNLLKEASPHWILILERKKTISISPSINRIKGCKSHFFVRKNKIDWVRNRYTLFR